MTQANPTPQAPAWADIINPEEGTETTVRTGRRRKKQKDGYNPNRHRPEDTVDTPGHILQLIGGLAFLLVLICLIQLVWQVKGSELDAIHAQEKIAINAGFDETKIPEGVAQPQEGDPPVEPQPLETQFIGWMYIPRLGADWKRVIQEGTNAVVLDNLGLGHYTGTAMPGGVGNSAYAGHRTPSDLGYADQLEHGDPIIIQTNDHWYVYEVQTSWIVPLSDVSVLEANGDARLLTLTTCDPMFQSPAPNRLIIRADFKYWANTADGTPAELLDVDTNPVTDTTANITEKIRDISKYAPVTPIFAVCCLLIWIIFCGLCWLFFHHDRVLKPVSWSPLTLLWRLQCGPVALRVITYLFMWLAIVFACWAWLCPWLANTIPGLESPYPGME